MRTHTEREQRLELTEQRIEQTSPGINGTWRPKVVRSVPKIDVECAVLSALLKSNLAERNDVLRILTSKSSNDVRQFQSTLNEC